MKRYYALLFTAEGQVQLVRELDGTTILASAPWEWKLYESYAFELAVSGTQIIAKVDGRPIFNIQDQSPLVNGAIGLLVEEGRVGCDAVAVHPL